MEEQCFCTKLDLTFPWMYAALATLSVVTTWVLGTCARRKPTAMFGLSTPWFAMLELTGMLLLVFLLVKLEPIPSFESVPIDFCNAPELYLSCDCSSADDAPVCSPGGVYYHSECEARCLGHHTYSNISCESSQPQECTDLIIDGSPWHDSDGMEYNCEWYSTGNHCSSYGNSYDNHGFIASEACCACGGGAGAQCCLQHEGISSRVLPSFPCDLVDAVQDKNDESHDYISMLYAHFGWMSIWALCLQPMGSIMYRFQMCRKISYGFILVSQILIVMIGAFSFLMIRQVQLNHSNIASQDSDLSSYDFLQNICAFGLLQAVFRFLPHFAILQIAYHVWCPCRALDRLDPTHDDMSDLPSEMTKSLELVRAIFSKMKPDERGMATRSSFLKFLSEMNLSIHGDPVTMEELEQFFLYIAKNNDKMVTDVEFLAAMSSECLSKPVGTPVRDLISETIRARVRKMFSSPAKHASPRSPKRFRSPEMEKILTPLKVVSKTFHSFDSDTDGRLTRQDFRELIQTTQKAYPYWNFSDEVIDKIFDKVDRSSTGTVIFEEFLSFCAPNTITDTSRGFTVDQILLQCCESILNANIVMKNLDSPKWQAVDIFASPKVHESKFDERCEICFEIGKYKLTNSIDCPHFYCKECIDCFMRAELNAGNFPVSCPQCKAQHVMKTNGHCRKCKLRIPHIPGLITPDIISGFANNGVIDYDVGCRFHRQQKLSMLKSRRKLVMAKSCPGCYIPVEHKRNHGPHRIVCPGCSLKFCFLCLKFSECDCPLECNDECDCEPCEGCDECTGYKRVVQ